MLSMRDTRSYPLTDHIFYTSMLQWNRKVVGLITSLSNRSLFTLTWMRVEPVSAANPTKIYIVSHFELTHLLTD